jgi:hypothetical protein
MKETEMATIYEFVAETLDFYPGCGDDPDVVDCCFFPELNEAHEFVRQEDGPWRIALVRDTGNDLDGLTGRFYAYPDSSGFLPERMETCTGAGDGPVVPKKYRRLIFPIMGSS